MRGSASDRFVCPVLQQASFTCRLLGYVFLHTDLFLVWRLCPCSGLLRIHPELYITCAGNAESHEVTQKCMRDDVQQRCL